MGIAMRWKRAASLGAILLALALSGCRSQYKPIMPRTGIIPIQVWVVLGPGESIGDQSNRGCRLSTQEITDRIRSLQNNAGIFGQNVTFQWQPATPSQAEDPALLPFMPRSRPWLMWHQQVVANYWQPGRLNIYFVGNVQLNGQNVIALTWDPAAAQSQFPERAWVLMNDCGWPPGNENQGFSPNFDPAQVTSYFSLEHEIAHYLGRFNNRSFGQPPNQRNYDSSEHVPDGSNNILELFVPPPHPLVVPGRWNQAQTEQQEIWDRIWAGTWNNP